MPDPREDVRRTLTGLQPLTQRPARRALTDVAARLRAEVDQAGTDLGRLADDIHTWWAPHANTIVNALLAVYEAAVNAVARWLGIPPPAGYTNLPGRHRDGDELPGPVVAYITAAHNRITLVGDDIAHSLRRTIANLTGHDDPDMEATRARLREAIAGMTGPARAERIAATETLLVWSTATDDQLTTAPEQVRPLVKSWRAVLDHRTRAAHMAVDGTTIPITDPFVVGGWPMDRPGDPTAPLHQIINCRCVALYGRSADDLGAPALSDSEVRSVIRNHDPHGGEVTAAGYTSGMVALVPSTADAARLALDGGEPAEELHLTLAFLGDATAWSPQARDALVAAIRDRVEDPADTELAGRPVYGVAFGTAHWNPGSDDPAWVWSVGDDRESLGLPLTAARDIALTALADIDGPELPAQHSPWQPHVTAAYSSDDLRAELADRLGPITFDRVRVAFAGEHVDIPLTTGSAVEASAAVDPDAGPGLEPVPWSTPGTTAIAFEDQETGDGRIFAPGALYWTGGPWPLQYADEMLTGHDGAELAGAITMLDRDGGRIPAAGVLYPSQPAGLNAIQLLTEGAPLGVSVDLDDVDIEVIDRSGDGQDEAGRVLIASLRAASVLRHADGSWTLRATHTTTLTADAGPLTATVTVSTGPDGTVPADQLRSALTAAGITLVDPAAEVARLAAQIGITAAAGDPDRPDVGTVVHTESAGDLLLRITRGRVRGATLVSVPAFADARITLDTATVTAAAGGGRMSDVVAYVAGSPIPVTAAMTGAALGITTSSARDYLARAATAGLIVRLARGLYIGAATLPETPAALTAAASGNPDLPIHDDRDAGWDGDAAASRVLTWATRSGGEIDADRLAQAFLYRDPDRDPATLTAYKLGIADVFTTGNGERLEIVPRAVFAVAAVLQGARGGVDIPDTEQDRIRATVGRLYERINTAFPDAPPVTPPWDDTDVDELEASAWQAMQDLPPMPAEWFAEPTPDELPPDSGGVHYRGGRIYGWVAQAGVPHDGHPGRRLTVDSLGDIDLTHFLRTRFALDNGQTVRVGAMTMNVGHHRDGAECETAACQFDDSRTVAGIVTVGVNARGMWFSGAAAPWLSEWDRTVFAACQPSYHLKRDGRRWSLRAVLSVPVPGHPSRLAAAAVDRSNLALAASAHPPVLPPPAGIDLAALAAAVADELQRRHLTTTTTAA